jgi:hypothetical protein
MHSPSSKVHLIVASDYGERLRDLPPGEIAWVADTPPNKTVVQHLWTQKREGITSFQVAPNATPEDWLISILDQVELHHGEYSQLPPYSALQVVGTGLSRRLRAALESYGFGQFEDTPDGFLAYKTAA